MKATDRPRFDIGTLRDLAGEKTFTRGEACHRDGQVTLISVEPARVLAEVAGTQNYRTELTGHGGAIGGACSCPAFPKWGFCKHMVAVGLAANVADGDGALSRIREHLKAKDADSLIEMIVDLARRDSAVLRRLDMAAAAAQGDEKAIEARLRRAIDNATRTGSYVEYSDAVGWAAGVDEALRAMADLLPGGHAGLVRKLADRAIERIERAMERVDDADGHCGAMLRRAGEIHVAAARMEPPEPVQFARELFGRELEDEYGTFSGAVELYADVLGEAGLTEYRRLATDAWKKVSVRTGATSRRHELLLDNHSLMGILDFFAERDGDVDARIALRARDLSSPWSYLQLAEFCLSQGREEEALQRAEEGLWMFEDEHPDTRLVFFTVDLLSKAGRTGDAEAHLWRAFEKAPSFDLYMRLHRLVGGAARDRAVRLVEERVAHEERAGWQASADLLVRILMHGNLLDAAWAIAGRHRVSAGTKTCLARASEATHPREALATYAELLEQLVGSGGNPAYAQAVELLARMAALRSADEQTAYVAAIKERFGRKRNFMKLLG